MIKKSIKHIILLLISFLSLLNSNAQTYHNEWINYAQTYFRLSTPETGVYRVTKSELEQAGVPFANINSPQNIQLIYKGQEIPCYTHVISENLEYIEFYAEKNNGWFDLGMYDDPAHQVNPHLSMINDTSAVFFTWNNRFDNLRYEAVSSQNFTGYTAISHCYRDTIQQYINTNSGQYRGGPSPVDCEYNTGEGFFDTERLEVNGTVTKTVGTPNYYPPGGNAEIELAFVSISNGWYNINIKGPQIDTDTIFEEKRGVKIKESVSAASLANDNQFIFSSTPHPKTETSFAVLSYISINYPSLLSFNNKREQKFSIPENTDNSLVEISAFDGGSEAILFDITGRQRIAMQYSGATHKALVKASATRSNLYVLNSLNYRSVTEISKAPMTNYGAISNKTVIISHPLLWEQAQNYALYRNAALINVEDLYDQFGYGIQKHPLSIRNFLNYIQDTWTTKPEYLFIIGKGVAAHHSRFNNTGYNNNLIPPMGHPASDVLLSAKIQNSGIAPSIATGRIAANTNQQVADYLAKVQTFESNKAEEWMKHAIHFGGGITAAEQYSFARYLEGYENTYENSLFAGYVSTFLKKSSDPIVISKTDSINDRINNGVSMLTFFGHGNASGFDQNTDEPAAYKNFGKYPLLLANSCYSGDIFLINQSSQSEQWVLIPDKGSIGFFAMVYEGRGSYLNYFSSEFFKQLCNINYGEPLGKVINETRKQIALRSSTEYYKSTIQQFTLHGDPCVVLNSFDKPDFVMKPERISFSPGKLTTELDSLTLTITPLNIGKAHLSPSTISINRIFGDGSVFDTVITLPELYFTKTISVKLPIDKLRGLGINTFDIHLDSYGEIDELDETNNSASVVTYITSTNVFPVVPYKYSLINTTTPVLKIATGDPYSEEQTSTFEIDTSYLFNSPVRYSQNITHSGGIIEWSPAISFEAGKTYYWRTSKIPDSGERSWAYSSFAIDNTDEGWQQTEIGQLKENFLQNMKFNETTRALEFETKPKKLSVQTYGSSAIPSYFNIAYDIDKSGDYSSCNTNRIIVVVIDSTTLAPWESDRGSYGHVNYPKCSSRSRTDLYYCFSNSATSVEALINFVNNEVPEGNYVLIYNAGNANYENWGEANWQGFESWYPNSRVRLQNNGDAYVLLFKKGSSSFIYERTALSTQPLAFSMDLMANFTNGFITSVKAGPAISWGEASISETTSNTIGEDSYALIYTVDNAGNETMIYDTLRNSSVDLSSVSATDFPFIKLQYVTSNPVTTIPNQLKKWKITYEPASDIAINPVRGGEFYADTLNQGEQGHYYVAYENISYKKSDSIPVSYWLIDHQNNSSVLKTKMLPPLNPGEFSFDSVTWETNTLRDNNTILAQFNSAGSQSISGNTFLEQNNFNNQVHKRFLVELDNTNPLLDVTFDGVHIMDGDLVSAEPEIIIQLKDENEYIALNDTSLFSMYMRPLNSGTEQKIELNGNPDVTFIPAQLPKNRAKLIYSAKFPEDGTYELRVQAVDNNGNESGANDYVISFEVINESSITNVFNYPNPFSTSTKFVFELTGSEIPDEMRIDIITVTGKVIKSIYIEDLEPIFIGKNITQYAWDGRDNFGDLVANGVYFYRFYAKLNGKQLKIRNTGTEQFFKNGFGKMYLLR